MSLQKGETWTQHTRRTRRTTLETKAEVRAMLLTSTRTWTLANRGTRFGAATFSALSGRGQGWGAVLSDASSSLQFPAPCRSLQSTPCPARLRVRAVTARPAQSPLQMLRTSSGDPGASQVPCAAVHPAGWTGPPRHRGPSQTTSSHHVGPLFNDSLRPSCIFPKSRPQVAQGFKTEPNTSPSAVQILSNPPALWTLSTTFHTRGQRSQLLAFR